MQSSGTAHRSRQRVARDAASRGLLGRAPVYLALALKDWRVIPRDLRNFAQLLGPLVLLPVVYLNMLGGAGSGRRAINPLQAANDFTGGRVDLSGVALAAAILLATSLICTQVSATAISMEGKAWWLIKAAPVPPWELVRGKFLVAWLPFVVLSTGLLAGAGLWQGFSLLGLLYGWFGVELLGAGLLAISLGCAMRWPRLDWQNPRQMRSGWATMVALLGEAVLGTVGGGFLCLPLAAQAFAPDLLGVAGAGGIAGATLVTVGLAWALLTLGLDHLPDVGEA